jgi:hypothetical protein
MQQRSRNHEAKSGSELVLLISFYAENGRRNSRWKRRVRGIEKDTLYYAAASTRPVSCCEFTVIRARPIRSSCWGNSNSDRQSSAAAKRIYLQQTANWPSVSLVWWTSCCAQCVQLVAREQLFLFLYWLGPKNRREPVRNYVCMLLQAAEGTILPTVLCSFFDPLDVLIPVEENCEMRQIGVHAHLLYCVHPHPVILSTNWLIWWNLDPMITFLYWYNNLQ